MAVEGVDDLAGFGRREFESKRITLSYRHSGPRAKETVRALLGEHGKPNPLTPDLELQAVAYDDVISYPPRDFLDSLLDHIGRNKLAEIVAEHYGVTPEEARRRLDE